MRRGVERTRIARRAASYRAARATWSGTGAGSSDGAARRFIYWPRLRLSRAIRAHGVGARRGGRCCARCSGAGSNLPSAPVLGGRGDALRRRCPSRCPAGPRRVTSRSARCRCGPTWPPTRCPTTIRDALRERVHVRYPIAIDRVLGLGKIPDRAAATRVLPRRRDQRLRARARLVPLAWFVVPHVSVAYVALAPPEGARAAQPPGCMRSSIWAPWSTGRCRRRRRGGRQRTAHRRARRPRRVGEYGTARPHGTPLPVRRMMLEYGERFWGERWNDLYDVLGGNPLAAMPSLHFATSLMAARLLSEVGPGRRCDRLGVRRHARAGAGLPGRALRGRPASRAPRSPRAVHRGAGPVAPAVTR